MTRDIININDFIILVEEASSTEPTVDTCTFDEPVIAVALYGSGNVDLNVNYNNSNRQYSHTKGLALSFYADEKVAFRHAVSVEKPLECIVIATSPRNLKALPQEEGELFAEMLQELVHPSDHYVEGPRFYMPPSMQQAVDQVFHNNFSGKTRMMFFRSQVTTLLAHYFGELANVPEDSIPANEREKLEMARSILLNQMDSPPSLSEISKQIGLNTFKLKKNFKELFGAPVFKYLQNERLNKAHELLRSRDVSIQEAAWQVGYDSLSSFSNAFTKKFGMRPSEIRQ